MTGTERGAEVSRDAADEDAGTSGARRAGLNAVMLRGRVSTAPVTRELPSGSSIVTLRVSAPRTASPMTKGSTLTSDWMDCVAWGAGQRRRVAGWRLGDLVEIEGALRRRCCRGGAGTTMGLEVEVLGSRLVARAARADQGALPGSRVATSSSRRTSVREPEG